MATYSSGQDEDSIKYWKRIYLEQRRTIASLEREIERLKKEMDAIVSLDELMVEKCQQIKAENARLKDVLKEFRLAVAVDMRNSNEDSLYALSCALNKTYSVIRETERGDDANRPAALQPRRCVDPRRRLTAQGLCYPRVARRKRLAGGIHDTTGLREGEGTK